MTNDKQNNGQKPNRTTTSHFLSEIRHYQNLKCETHKDILARRDKVRQLKSELKKFLSAKKMKFLSGDTISGADFIDIINFDKFFVNGRTKITIIKSVHELNRTGEIWYIKRKATRKPELSGTRKVISDYVAYVVQSDG